ncbi:uncharacterized protein [Ptychodera flava]|uniref:uncharacterized protein isoform X2 n=1 Tax=Ptychodera flava TaxID=63121 RepID=UPI00396A47EC
MMDKQAISKGPMIRSPRSQTADTGTSRDTANSSMSDAAVRTRIAADLSPRSCPDYNVKCGSERREAAAPARSSNKGQDSAASSKQRRKSHEKMGTRMAVPQPSSAERFSEAENGKAARENCTPGQLQAIVTPSDAECVTTRRSGMTNCLSRELRKSHPVTSGAGQNEAKEKRHAGRVLKAAHSCPALTDLSDLKLDCNSSKNSISRAAKQTSKIDQVTKPAQALGRHLGKLHRTSSNISRYTIAGSLPSEQLPQSRPPKPPSWQNFVRENNQSKPEGPASSGPNAGDPNSNGLRCAYCKEQYSCCHGNEQRRVPPKIRRTRSLLTIDERDLPETELVISLSETKPMEFNLKQSVHDDRIYLRENDVRCRKWLETVQESDIKPHEMETEVTCEVEMDEDKLEHWHDQCPSTAGDSSDGDTSTDLSTDESDDD